MPVRARLRASLELMWMIWATAAVILTLVVGGWLTVRAFAAGQLPVDATLGALVSAKLGWLLMILWVPVFLGAVLGHRRFRRERRSRHPVT